MMAISVITLAILVNCVFSQESTDVNPIMPSIIRERCTTVAVGPKAGINGAMNTQNVDCLDCDFRVAKVPAMDWPEGSTRPLLQARSGYPAYITGYRGPTWDPDNIEGTPSQIAAWGRASNVTGYIPQVPHTFALIEAQYGIVNEKQVSMGETTCPSRFWATPVFAGGKARIEIGELTKVGLERASTAREAIRIMGDLAVKYGFYGSDWSGGDNAKGDSGEALTVIDKTEAWVFHVTADDTATSAVWAAKRVPDDHVTVVSDQFVIREVDPDSNDFMFSENLWEVAARNKLYSYSSNKKLDFLKTYGVARYHSSYATRRVWRIFGMVAPSIWLPPYTNMWADDYPFSIPVDKQMSVLDLMAIMRDHYEGTEFDLTQGMASGPYGEPNRWDVTTVDNMTWSEMLEGAYERSTSIFRTSNSFVANARPSVPDSLALLWFAQYAPSSASYTPLYLNTESIPPAYMKGSLFQYDSSVSFWNFCAAGNYAARFYKYAMADVKVLQDSLMATALAAVTETEALAVTLTDPTALVTLLTKTTHEQAANVVQGWKDLLPQLITKYHDGYQALDLDQPNIWMKSFFYPKYWLDATGYWNNKPNTAPGTIQFEPNPTVGSGSTTSLLTVALITAVISCVSTLFIGAYWLRNQNKKVVNNKEYISINL